MTFFSFEITHDRYNNNNKFSAVDFSLPTILFFKVDRSEFDVGPGFKFIVTCIQIEPFKRRA